MAPRKILYIYIFFIGFWGSALSQRGTCIPTIGAIYGSETGNEQGYSLVPTTTNDGFYLGGAKEDSVLLLKVNLYSEVLWARTFKIVPNQSNRVSALCMDSEGMLVISGTAGDPFAGSTVFIFRYNPNNDQIFWSKEYSSPPSNQNASIIQKTPGGNYLSSNIFFDIASSNNDTELLEIDKNSGDVIPAFSQRYDLGSSEGLADLVMYQNFIYGTGRYTDGPTQANMRHTIVKLNPNDGTQVWAKMGHEPKNVVARLYGFDLLIDQGEIYSGYFGDPSGISSGLTRLYLQKTSLAGDIVWVYQYDLPGTNDAGFEMIKSGNGYVVLAGSKTSPGVLILFKIDSEGNVLWSWKYQFAPIVNVIGNLDNKASQLIEVGNKLVFTAYAANSTGGTNILLVRTDLNGVVDIPCVENISVSIPVFALSSPVFYPINPTMNNYIPTQSNHSAGHDESFLLPRMECTVNDTTYSFINATICAGQQLEGYTASGVYVDNFITTQGCDSIRTLTLTVELLEKFQDVTICSGTSFENHTQAGIYIDTIQSGMNSCDTVRHLTIMVLPPFETMITKTICEGASFLGYNTTGIYIDTFLTSGGCDSFRTLNLTVGGIITNQHVVICLGENYQGHSLPGIYSDTLITSDGCDSISILNLEVVPLEKAFNIQICQGDSFENYSLPGIYTDTIHGPIGSCDTIRTITLSYYPPNVNSIEETICAGENYFGYTVTGMYTDTFLSSNGCDSIRTVLLTIIDAVTSYVEAQLCEGQVLGHTTPGTYIDTLVSFMGCDSIRTLVLNGQSKFITNIFSPNGDGINDQITIIQFPETEIDFQYFGIFDRFGNSVYEASEWPIKWNGKSKDGREYNPGVFAYLLVYNCGDDKITESGAITLIK